jgi:hypothetical protein
MAIPFDNEWGFYIDLEEDFSVEKKVEHVVQKKIKTNAPFTRENNSLNHTSNLCIFRAYCIIVLCIFWIYIVFICY